MTATTPDKQRAFALQVVERLRAAGFDAFWAGGCVRDQLLGITPKDYDVATSAPPVEVRRLFGRKRTIPVGISFGVVTVLGRPGEGQIEVATFRTDAEYSDGRHPDHVEFANAQYDAARRDFTINGLFFDPVAGEVLDYVGGEADLAAGVIRAIGNPQARLQEDKLRMLRAVRFAARFGFEMEPATLAAIRDHAAEVAQVSGERIGAEMREMLTHQQRAKAIALLRESALEPHVLPETTPVRDEAWDRLLRVVAELHAPSVALALAALLAPIGDARVSPAISERWKLAKRDADRADWLLDHLEVVLAAEQTPWPQLQRVLVHDGAVELLDLAEAIAGRGASPVAFCRDKLALPPEQLDPPPLVTGDDLIAQGISPGPRLGELLEAIRDAQLEGQIATKEQALHLAATLGP